MSFKEQAYQDKKIKNDDEQPDVYEHPEDDGAVNEEEKKPSSQSILTDFGELSLPSGDSNIHVITIIGQVEGHIEMPPQNKATKYEHVIPQLVAVEQNEHIEGLIVILNTVGGDVEAGLAIAEMIASISKPTVSLVLGGGHSIGVPIAVSADTAFIAPTATMTIHPIRLTGMVVGVQQSFDYLERMQERVISFVTSHSNIDAETFRELMMTTGELARDVGTIVVGENAVKVGLIDRVGGLGEAIKELNQRIDERRIEQGKEPRYAKKPGQNGATRADNHAASPAPAAAKWDSGRPVIS